MNRTIPSIISFIILIQRKYVLINSAKSLFMRVRSKGFRPDTFKPKMTNYMYPIPVVWIILQV